jgi:chorismate mutase
MTLFALDTDAGTQERLEACRQKIDSLDQRIVELIQKRAQVVAEVGNLKREAHLPVTVASREKQVIRFCDSLGLGH